MRDNLKLDQLDALLKSKNVDYVIFRDDFSLESAEAGAKHYGISLAETTPTLILKSKDQYYAAIICGNTRISFKKLKQALGVKEISMVDPQTVFQITGANVGEVSLVNAELITLVDNKVLSNENCYGGCGTPKSTLKINTTDLVNLTKAKILDFADPRS
jgi:Cys-tRNA(Pro)/Cys-tRNA(Cys) deacylase